MTINPNETIYSGADVTTFVFFEDAPAIRVELPSLHTVSISFDERKGPARSLGYKGLRGWTRGIRTIAGNMIFNQTGDNNLLPLYTALWQLVDQTNGQIRFPGWSLDSFRDGTLSTSFSKELDFFNYVPSVFPPFSMIAVFVDEKNQDIDRDGFYAGASVLRGIEYSGEQVTLSIHDAMIEGVYPFIATEYAPFNHQYFRQTNTTRESVVDSLAQTATSVENLERTAQQIDEAISIDMHNELESFNNGGFRSYRYGSRRDE